MDVSAPPHLIATFMTYFDPTGDVCLVIAATQVCPTSPLSPLSPPHCLIVPSQVGSNDRKRDVAVELIDKCGPSLVTGRLADVYTLGQAVTEKSE